MPSGVNMKITMLMTRKKTKSAIIMALYGWLIEKSAEAMHSMDCSVTLAIEPVEFDQRLAVTRTTL